MSASEILHSPITELSRKLRKKECTSVELTTAFLNHTKKSNPSLQSFLTIAEESALEQAKKADEMLEKTQPHMIFAESLSLSKTSSAPKT